MKFDLGEPPGHDLPVDEGCHKVDFMFVIDDSGSMADDQANLIANFPTFIDGIQSTLTRVQEYHIGVIPTDKWWPNVAGCQLLGGLVVSTLAESQKPVRLGIGRPATPDEIRVLDIDVMPSGVGLPEGRGSVAEGATTYATKCASCHGPGGENGKFDRLVGRDSGDGFAFAKDARLVKTIGNYWPYATTLFDYTARSMPFLQPGTLSANEVYGLVAYLL